MSRLHLWPTLVLLATCAAIYLSSEPAAPPPAGPESMSVQQLPESRGGFQELTDRLFPDKGQSPLTPIGAAAVFVFYYVRFSRLAEPPKLRLRDKPTRHFTSGIRYISFACLYASFFVAAYFLLVAFPEISSAIAKVIPADFSETLSKSLREIGDGGDVAPYVVIILLFAPHALGAPEQRFRSYMQRLAYIPGQAIALCDRLKDHPEWFEADPEVVKKLLTDPLSNRLLFPEDFGGGAKSPLRAAYARTLYFSRCLATFTGLELRGQYDPEIEEYRSHIHDLEQKIDRLRSDFVAYSRRENPEQTAGQSDSDIWAQFRPDAIGSNGTGAVIARDAEQILDRIRALLPDLYVVMVCALLARERFPQERCGMFERMGIALPKDPIVAVDGNTVIGTLLSLAAAIGIPTLVYYMIAGAAPPPGGGEISYLRPRTSGDAALWALIGIILHFGAVLVAIFTKRSGEMHRTRPSGAGPWRRYLMDYYNASAVAFSAAVWLLTGMIALSPAYALSLSDLWPWAAAPAVTGAAVAWHVDTYWTVHAGYAGWSRRAFYNTLIQGGATCAVAVLVTVFVLDPMSHGGLLSGFLDQSGPFLVYVGATTLMVGAFVGFWFPRLYGWQMARSSEHVQLRREPKDQRNPRCRLYERRPKTLLGRWISGDVSADVAVRDVSTNGISLSCELDSPVGTAGTLELFGVGFFPARIVRKADDLTGLEFQFEAPLQQLRKNLHRAA